MKRPRILTTVIQRRMFRKPGRWRRIGDRERRWHDGAFTLVELLVVLAIIGILVALILPAVQAARGCGEEDVVWE